MEFPFSGTAGISTSGDTAVDLLALALPGIYEVTVINESSNGGHVSLGGTSWARLPGPGSRTFSNVIVQEVGGVTIRVRRQPSGSDLSNVFADAFHRVG